MVVVKVKKVDPSSPVQIPKFAYPTDACADIQSNVDITLKPGEIKLVPTGIVFEIPAGYEIQLRPRSGLALKHGITLLNTPATIDQEYRGEIKIIMINLGRKEFAIHKGDRIAQVAVRPVPQVEFVEVDEVDNTSRGVAGFGSSGVKG